MKIGFVLDASLDDEDGVQAYILTLGRWLKAQGHEVHYLVGETSRTDVVNVHSLAKNMTVKFNGNKVSIPMPSSKRRIKALLTSEKFDVLHVQVPYSPFFAARVVRLASRSAVIVGTFHILPYSFLANVGTKLLGFLLRNNVRLFDAHMSVSTAAQDFAWRAFRISSKVVPNMVDIDKYRPAEAKKRTGRVFKILFLGRLVDRKGCAYLLHALVLLRRAHPKCKFTLIICGKGELENSLKEQARLSGLFDVVTFTGFVSEKEKILYMQQADLSVFPSYAGESFGIVLIEAMAAQSRVVIAGKNPGYCSVLGDISECIVDVKDIYQFSAKLYEIMKSSDLIKSIYTRQQTLVEQFDYKLVGKEIIELYENCKKAASGR